MNTITYKNQQFTPSKILCIGRNYVAHIEELGNEIPDEMVVFAKFNSCLTTELHSYRQEPLHYEAELCFLCKKGELHAVAIGLDLTKRDLQSKLKSQGLPWERAKAFDGSAVISEFVEFDPQSAGLSLQLWINDQLAQQGSVELMMYQPETIRNELSSMFTLEDGDVIMTGTPKGVGVVNAGDRFVGKVFQNGQCILETSWIAL
jgi:2-keto-4-pentenoate hydratase/2-oxohepta-3-ene-1,7-dioic acid hydratase in catechol pathway